MRRRDFLRMSVSSGLAILGASIRAQSGPGARRIGVMLPVPGNDPFLDAFRTSLMSLGWKPDQDFVLEVRRADGTVAQFRQFGSELAAAHVDIMVTASTAATTALGETGGGIPVVFVGTFDPVAAGLVDSMDHPGRHLTGLAGFQNEIARDWVSTLKQVAPQISRFGIFYNPASVAKAALAGWKGAAAQTSEVFDVPVLRVEDIGPTIGKVAADARSGLIVVPHTFPFANRKVVVEAMAAHRVPAIYGIAEMVRAGGLISYGQDLGAQWALAANFVDKILKGTSPADIPAQWATKYALAINKHAAGNLGVAIPADLLSRADEIVG